MIKHFNIYMISVFLVNLLACSSTSSSPTFSISGAVISSSGEKKEGVSISLTGSETYNKITDNNGNYTFSNIANGQYTLTPSLSGFIFSPLDRKITINGNNLTDNNFIVTLIIASDYNPKPGDVSLKIGPLVPNVELVSLSGVPQQFALRLSGSLSTPCSNLRIVRHDTGNRIDVEVYSVFDPEIACISVIEYFQVEFKLGNFPKGLYSLWVNGINIKDFEV